LSTPVKRLVKRKYPRWLTALGIVAARVVDEDVEPVVALFESGCSGADRVERSKVAVERLDVRVAALFHDALGDQGALRVVARGDDDACAAARKLARGDEADSRGSAGDEADPGRIHG